MACRAVLRTGCRAVAQSAKAGHFVEVMGGRTVTYVYILNSETGDHFYVGMTAELRGRLQQHNAGSVRHTAKFRPWVLKTYVAFSDSAQAVAFEKYLKSASGRAFAKKRL